VKVLGLITLGLAVLFVVVHLTGGGFHHHGHVGGETPPATNETSAD
jgi:hypothetical protein